MSASPDAGRTEFDVVVHRHGTTRTVAAAGEIDLESAERLRLPLWAALRDGAETVVLDLGETTFIDSCGIRLVFEIDARARDLGARLVILPGPPTVRQVFEVCGLTEILTVVGSD
jgi:anti-sigma B factor antagonist